MPVGSAEPDDLSITHRTEERCVSCFCFAGLVGDEFQDRVLRLCRTRPSSVPAVPKARSHFVRVKSVDARAAPWLIRAARVMNAACNAFSTRSPHAHGAGAAT